MVVTSIGVDDPPENERQDKKLTSNFPGCSQSCLQLPEGDILRNFLLSRELGSSLSHWQELSGPLSDFPFQGQGVFRLLLVQPHLLWSLLSHAWMSPASTRLASAEGSSACTDLVLLVHHPLMDTWVASMFWHSCTMLLGACMCRDLAQTFLAAFLWHRLRGTGCRVTATGRGS